MTIFEVLIALFIVTLLFGFGLKVARSTFDAEGKRLMQRLQGTIKYFYSVAAIEGKVYRFALDFGAQRLSVEVESQTKAAVSAAALPASPTKGAAADASAPATSPQPPATKKEDRPQPGPAFTAATGPAGLIKPFVFPPKVILREVRVSHRKEPITEGTAHLHCYPGGHVDPVTLIFSDETQRYYFVLQTQPLTGLSRISRKPPETE